MLGSYDGGADQSDVGGCGMKKVIEVEGYKAFRGIMKIEYKSLYAMPMEIAGEWLYKPDTGCWYCGGRSYPDVICTIVKVQ